MLLSLFTGVLVWLNVREHNSSEFAWIDVSQIQEHKIDLRATQIREELALVMPHLLKPRDKLSRHERLDALQDKADLEEKL